MTTMGVIITNEFEPIRAPILVPGDNRKDCCKLAENLEYHEIKKGELVVYRCKRCGCRHFEMTAQPGKLGVLGSAMGG